MYQIYIYIVPTITTRKIKKPTKENSGVGRCRKVWGGGTQTHVPSVKNQYNRDVIEYIVIYVMVIEIFHKIINWYMKDAK